MSFSVARDFGRALERGELSPVFQPVRRLSDGALTGAEALMRWTHPIEGVIEPACFISAGERDGSLSAPGAWILGEALSALSEWRGSGAPSDMFVAVNISMIQLSNDDILGHCRSLLSDLGLDRESLRLELTESAPLEPVHAAPQIRALHEDGFHLVLDDFGVGHSTLAHLHGLPFRTLKIDRSFVSGLPDDRDSRIIVESVIRLAHDLGLEVIAEGIEYERQLRFLDGIGCDMGQGFLFGGPAVASDMDAAF